MGGFNSIWHWLIVIAVVVILFGGRGRLSGIMGDFAKGVKAFRSGMKEEPSPAEGPHPDAPKIAASEAAKPAPQAERDEAAKH